MSDEEGSKLDQYKVVEKGQTSYVIPISESAAAKRKITISSFKKKVRVDLREFYQDKETEEWKPSKKGISLDKEQFEKIISLKELIDEAFKALE